MRIQTRLFLGTAALVVALAGIQWALHERQLGALEREIGAVAASVGQGLLAHERVLVRRLDLAPQEHVVLLAPPSAAVSGAPAPDGRRELRVERRVVERATWHAAPGAEGDSAPAEVELRVEATGDRLEGGFLVVRLEDGEETRVPIPTAPTARVVRRGLQQGLLGSALVLSLGLAGAAVLARRLAQPLGRLAAGAEALGRGDTGVRVPVTSRGEIGELEATFNRMAERLQALEAERDGWRAREHLARLGDVARGLAHTLRNPLHTVGLAVEELAGGTSEPEQRAELADTARAQIRRVDQWLRSFLAVAAGDGGEPEVVDLRQVVDGVVLEAVQGGAAVEVVACGEPMPVRLVPGAVRAALASLLDNALQASPPGAAVSVGVAAAEGGVEVELTDRGPGLPEAVRQRLFSPHVTTRPEGSGMGLYLARELLLAQGGRLAIGDATGGGTCARVWLPLAPEGDDDR